MGLSIGVSPIPETHAYGDPSFIVVLAIPLFITTIVVNILLMMLMKKADESFYPSDFEEN